MKTIIYYILISMAASFGIAQDLNQPLLISGTVTNASGGHINQEELHFQVYLKDYSDYFLNEDSHSCGYDPPVWFAELGNLSVEWQMGDMLTIIIEDQKRREQIRYDWQIDSTALVPDLRTQSISIEEEIHNFTLSDRGVFHGIPVNFAFNSIFDRLTGLEFKIISPQGSIVYQSNTTEKIEVNKYQFSWDGRSSAGGYLRSGVYFYFFSSNQQLIHSGLVSLKND